MKRRIFRQLGAAAIAFSAVTAIAAEASLATAHNAARQALASQNYAAVISAYDGILNLTPAAKYRLAIAHSRTGDPVKAHLLLRDALADDPKGTFASSPQRLQTFADSLLLACEEMAFPGCQKPEPPAQSSEPERSASSAESAPPGADSASPDVSTGSSISTPAPPAVDTAPPVVAPIANADVAHPVEQAESQSAASWTMAVATVASVFFLTLFVLVIRARKVKNKLPDGLASLQSLHSAAKKQLEVLPPSCALAQSLQNLMPHLEREVGRAFLTKNGDPSRLTRSDAAVHAVRERFKGRPISVADATPEEVAALFQSVRWN